MNFSQVFKSCFNKHGYNLKISSKMATLGLLKIKVFRDRGYGGIIPVYDITSKILSCGSSYIVNVVMWLKSVTLAFQWE